MNVLIPDSGSRPLYRSVLAMTRSLGRDHRVYIGSATRRLSRLQRLLKSRYCTAVVPIANAEEDPDAFVGDVNRLARDYRIDVLLPYSDEIATVASQRAHDLDVAVPLPPFETFVRGLDKGDTVELAQRLGLPTPRTVLLSACLLGEVPDDFPFPAVVKPRRRGGRAGTHVVGSRAELGSILREFERIGDRLPVSSYSQPVVQEFVPGRIHDCCVLYQNGRSVAMLTQIRHRTDHPHGGVGVVDYTTDVPELRAHSRQIMDALGWHGPAQLEWIRDERDGCYRLLEINPRFWGTTELSIKAGLDFARLAVRMSAGETLDGKFSYTVGAKERWAFPDELLSVVRDRSNWWKRLREFVSLSDLVDRNCFFSTQLSDPAPELFRVLELGTWVASARARKRAACPHV